MKKLVKILPVLMIVLVILTVCTPVLAGGKTIGDVTINPDAGTSTQSVQNIGNTILGIIRVIGTVIAVGVLMVIGIKYMMGSAEEKAEYKKTMLPYIIGAVILFAAVQVAGYVYDLSKAFAGGSESDKDKKTSYVVEMTDIDLA